MAHQPYLYLKLLLRNNLFLDLDEYALNDTPRHGLVCNFMGMRLASAFQLIFRADGKTVGREALLRATSPERGDIRPEAAFADALRENRLVQFDRLVRVVHHILHNSRSRPRPQTPLRLSVSRLRAATARSGFARVPVRWPLPRPPGATPC